MDSTTPPPPSGPFPFMRLPEKLRQRIYTFCVPHGQSFNVATALDTRDYGHPSKHPQDSAPTTPGNTIGILLTCRKISNEVQSILYEQNTFIIDVNGLSERLFARNINTEIRTKMKTVVVNLRERPQRFDREPAMDHEIWESVFRNANRVFVVAIQPKSTWAQGHCHKKWMAWVEECAKYIEKNIPGDAQIAVAKNCHRRVREDLARVLEGALPERTVGHGILKERRLVFQSWGSGEGDLDLGLAWEA